MFKNVKLKRMIKSTITPILSGINRLIPKNDKKVLLYSPNFGIEHNLKPFRDYLLENGYEKKYEIICGVSDEKYFENDGLRYVKQMKAFVFFLRAKHVFYTTGQIPIKPVKSQFVIHLDHGVTGIKTANLLSNINNGDDFFFNLYCASSEIYRPVVMKEFACSSDNIVINSETVTDIFFRDTKKYDLGKYSKIGIWTPTFRQSDYLGYDDSQEELLPTLVEEDYEEFNKLLHDKNIYLIVKLHSAQDLTRYSNLKFSNLAIYSDKDFKESGMDLYVLLKQMDFMLADYSSIYMHYLLLNKPIGFVIPDIDEYAKKRGFVFENIQSMMPGMKIMNKQELFDFIESVSRNNDQFNHERERVNELVNQFRDGKSSDRLIQYSHMSL